MQGGKMKRFMGAGYLSPFVGLIFASALPFLAAESTWYTFEPAGDGVEKAGAALVQDHNAQHLWYGVRPGEHCVRVFDSLESSWRPFAGSCDIAGYLDSRFRGDALFSSPSAICRGRLGNLFVLDLGNRALRIVQWDGSVVTAGVLDNLWPDELLSGGIKIVCLDDGTVDLTDSEGVRLMTARCVRGCRSRPVALLSSFFVSSASAFGQAFRDLADGSIGAVSRAMNGVRTLDLVTAALALCVSSAIFAYVRRQMWEGRERVQWVEGNGLADAHGPSNRDEGQTPVEPAGAEGEEVVEPDVKDDDGCSCGSQESAEEVEKSVMQGTIQEGEQEEVLNEEQLPVSTYGADENPQSDSSDEFVVISERD